MAWTIFGGFGWLASKSITLLHLQDKCDMKLEGLLSNEWFRYTKPQYAAIVVYITLMMFTMHIMLDCIVWACSKWTCSQRCLYMCQWKTRPILVLHSWLCILKQIQCVCVLPWFGVVHLYSSHQGRCDSSSQSCPLLMPCLWQAPSCPGSSHKLFRTSQGPTFLHPGLFLKTSFQPVNCPHSRMDQDSKEDPSCFPGTCSKQDDLHTQWNHC